MKELEDLDQFPFVEAKMLVGCTDLGKLGVGINQSDHQPETVFVERIISAVGALSWRDTFSSTASSSLPGAYIACSLGWRIALAKLQGLKEIEALILCYD